MMSPFPSNSVICVCMWGFVVGAMLAHSTGQVRAVNERKMCDIWPPWRSEHTNRLHIHRQTEEQKLTGLVKNESTNKLPQFLYTIYSCHLLTLSYSTQIHLRLFLSLRRKLYSSALIESLENYPNIGYNHCTTNLKTKPNLQQTDLKSECFTLQCPSFYLQEQGRHPTPTPPQSPFWLWT